MICSKSTSKALVFLGRLVKISRSQQKMSQAELAERLQVSRQTIISMEKGSPKVSIGVVFEAACLLGVPLLAHDQELLSKWEAVLVGFEAVLPARVSSKNVEVDDDF